MEWTRRSASILALGAPLGLMMSRHARADEFPDPKDEDKLFEGAKKEGTVVWYGGAPLEPMQGMARDFEGKYPGVKIQILRMVGVAQYQRYMQETQAKQYIADVLHVGDEPSMADLIEQGYVVDWKVPSLDRVPPESRIKTNAYTSYIIDGAIAYNPNKVSAEEAALLGRDWNGILDPRFKGRIATTDQKSGGHIAMIQMLLDPKFGDRFGLPYMEKLAAQKLVIYNDVQVPVDRIIAGDQDIAVWPSEGTTYSKWAQGAPIRWVHPKPTVAFGNTWFGISKFAPHPYAARLFLNWVMSNDGAKAVQTKYGGISTLSGVTDERPVTKEAWYQPITEKYVPDWNCWSAQGDKDFAVWEKLMKASR